MADGSMTRARAALLGAAAHRPNPTIERLRSVVAAGDEGEAPLSLEQLRIVVDGLVTCAPLAVQAARSGLDLERVLDAVAALGTWLTHTKGASGVTVVSPEELDALPLLQVTPPPLGKPKRSQPQPAPARRRARKPAFVVVPDGFDPRACKRDVRQSIGAIVASRPSNAELVRFISRKYRRSNRELPFTLVSVVWYFDKVNRLAEIGDVNPRNRDYLATVVMAYDLLEVARRDAMESLATVVDPDAGPEQIAAALVKVRPLFEGDASRLERLASSSSVTGSTGGRMLDKERRFLAERVVAAPGTFVVSRIGLLNEGQVRRIAEAAGLPVDSPTRSDAADIRARLSDLGLAADADMLVPEALQAEKHGHEREFWTAMDRLASGDPDWRDELVETGVLVTV